MNDSQLSMLKSVRSVVSDVSRKVESLHQQNKSWPRHFEGRIRLSIMKEEADDLVSIVTDQFSEVTPELLSNLDGYYDDVRDRLVDLQTQLNSFGRRYSKI